jgi:hypothetical protein
MPNTAALGDVATGRTGHRRGYVLPQRRPITRAILSAGALRTVLRDIRDHDLEEIEEPTRPVFDPVPA